MFQNIFNIRPFLSVYTCFFLFHLLLPVLPSFYLFYLFFIWYEMVYLERCTEEQHTY